MDSATKKPKHWTAGVVPPGDRVNVIEGSKILGKETKAAAVTAEEDSYVLVECPDGGEPFAVFSDGSYARWTPGDAMA